MRIPLQRMVRCLWRALLLACVSTILLVLTDVSKRYSVEADSERVANACVVLAALSFVALTVAWCQRRAGRAAEDHDRSGDRQLWVSALLVTAFLGVFGLTYLAFLLLVPSPFETPSAEL